MGTASKLLLVRLQEGNSEGGGRGQVNDCRWRRVEEEEVGWSRMASAPNAVIHTRVVQVDASVINKSMAPEVATGLLVAATLGISGRFAG